MHRARAGARLVKLPDAARYTRGPVWLIGRPRSARFRQDFPPNRHPPVAGGSWDPRSRGASALRMSRREMLRERQVAAPLMARRAARGALRPAHRRFQPGEGVSVQLAGLRLSGKPQRPPQCQFGRETPGLRFALITPAASRPGQHCAVRRQRGRQVAPCGHTSTVGQLFLRLVLRDDQDAQCGLDVGRKRRRAASIWTCRGPRSVPSHDLRSAPGALPACTRAGAASGW